MNDNLSLAPSTKTQITNSRILAGGDSTKDPVFRLLQDKRSPQTRRAYKGDLVDFFGGEPTPDVVKAFAGQPVPALAEALVVYQDEMRQRGLATATSNRRISAIKSLLKMCYKMGLSATDGRNLVDAEKTKAYRDTRGTDVDNMKRLIALPDRATLKGKRDYAIMQLLCDNALRRAEICALNVGDFWPVEKRIAILGKGKGNEKEFVTLHPATAAALSAYVMASGHWEGNGLGETPLFLTCDHRPQLAGARLGATGLYKIVGTYAKEIGLKLSPHKFRHSSITAALDASGGDLRKVQRLSRHAKLETLQIYDDNRSDMQGEMTNLLGDLLHG